MDDLLIPEISLSVDDEPVKLDEGEEVQQQEEGIALEEQNGDIIDLDEENVSEPKNTSEDASGEALCEPENANQENLNPDQVPEPYTLEEMSVHQQILGPGQQAVQFQRTHCTACNNHLGSAPNQQNKRYIHPLLKVLICKDCFEFYGSGEFDKDEDGSELYCRWCGQGGKVLCCAQCPYVFCQKCIRLNLGKKILDTVKESDDWMCFVCNPTQIINLRVICRALYEFVEEEKRVAAELKQPERLSVDSTLCCNKQRNIVPKRKQSDAADGLVEGDDTHHKKKRMKFSILSYMMTAANENRPPSNKTYPAPAAPRAWESQVEDEVVCTPDLALLMDDDESSLSTPAALTQNEATSPPPLSTSPPPLPTSPLPSPVSPQPSCSGLPFVQPTPPPLAPLPLYSNSNPVLSTAKNSDIQFVGQTRITSYKPIRPAVQPRTYVAKANALGYRLPTKPPVISKPLAPNSVTRNIAASFVQLQAPSVRFTGGDRLTSHPIVTVAHNRNNSVIDTPPARLAPGLRYEWFDKAAQFTARVNQNLSTRLCTLSKDQSTVTSLEGLATIHNSLQEILSNSINSLMQIRKNLRTDFIAGLKKLKFCKVADNIVLPQPVVDDNDVIIVDSNTTVPAPPFACANSADGNRPHGYIKVKPASELLDASIITIPDENVVTPIDNIVTTNSDLNQSESVIPYFDNPLEPEINIITNGTPKDADVEEITNQNNQNSIDNQPPASNYINTNEQLSEISEVLNPETLSLIKQALLESNFERIVDDNLKTIKSNIPRDQLKRMLCVRVVVERKFGRGTPRTNPRKGFRAFNIYSPDEEDIEQVLSSSVVVNTSKRQAFDDSFSAFIANMTQKSPENEEEVLSESHSSNDGDDVSLLALSGNPKDSTEITNVEKESVHVDEKEEAHDLQTVDSGIDVDGEQSLSNGVIN